MSKYYLVTVGQISWGDTYGDVEEFGNLKEAAERSVKTSYYDTPVIIVGDRVPFEMFEEIIEAKKKEIAQKAAEQNAEMAKILKDAREGNEILYQEAVERNSRSLAKAIEILRELNSVEGSG